MTVPDFLLQTSISIRDIARHCNVHKTQVYRWKRGKSLPAGDAAFKLMELMTRGVSALAPALTKRGKRSAA